MKKLILILVLSMATPARADLFGGDVAVLTQILANALIQLQQLRSILGTASGELDLIRQINQGINDSLNLIQTLTPNLDPGIYRDWTTQDAVSKLQSLYGTVVNSPDAQVQNDTDETIAEAVSFNNSYYKYTAQLDQVGEQIKVASHAVSPGGASKLTAQALGLVIEVLNQSLRAQATALKLQGQALALTNKREKDETKNFLEASDELNTAVKSEKVDFSVPRF